MSASNLPSVFFSCGQVRPDDGTLLRATRAALDLPPSLACGLILFFFWLCAYACSRLDGMGIVNLSAHPPRGCLKS